MDNYKRERRILRLMNKVLRDEKTGCWNWQAARFAGENGSYKYGAFWWDVNNISAHRAAWILLRSDIPEDKQVLHKCHNMACCNPDHLYLGDHTQNMIDRSEAGRTSKWDHRYNFKRSPELLQAVKIGFQNGMTVKEVCDIHGIGWQTVYRLRDQDAELKAIMAEGKSARYSAAAKRRANGH